MKIEVRLFDELVETFDLERPDEVVRLVEYMNFHSRNRRYRLRSVFLWIWQAMGLRWTGKIQSVVDSNMPHSRVGE